MTLQEFTERTGLNPSEKEFGEIHKIYMQTYMNKDEFCQEWVKAQGSKLVTELAGRLEARATLMQKVEKKVERAFEMLVRKSVEYNDGEMSSLSVMLTDEVEVIKCKLKGGLSLNAKEREMLLERLK